MNWGSAAEFFAMGGRGFYVWGSYAACALLIVAELVLLRGRRRTLLSRLSRSLRSKRENP
jgi:heme exporter protein D